MAEPRIMALTVMQPWALAIAELGKTVENRSWQTNYRGLVAIHAGARADDYASFPLREADRRYRALKAMSLLAGEFPPEAARLGFRRIVAVATLTGIHHADDCRNLITEDGPLCSPWAFHDEHHWVLEQVRPLDPVPCHPGKLGLWKLPGDVESAVSAQLEARDAR